MRLQSIVRPSAGVYYRRLQTVKIYLAPSSKQRQLRMRTTLFETVPFDNIRLSDMDDAFANKRNREAEWPFSLPDPKDLFRQFRQTLHSFSHNITCGCCACVFHDPTVVRSVSLDYAPLSLLKVDPIAVPYNFSTGIPVLDQHHILVEKKGIHFDPATATTSLTLCNTCALQLASYQLPPAALANCRWLGEVPEVLQGLTWIEERLIARAHISGIIYRLERRSNSSYLGIKGHAVVYPQDTRALLDLLPLPPSRLPDTVRVVWTGKSSPSPAELRNKLSVRTQRVYDALQWLRRNNEDYRDITIDYAEFAKWPPVFIVDELLSCMGHISDNVVEQIARSGPASNQDEDSLETDNDIISSSGILDTNDVTQSANAATLRRIACLLEEDTINVIHGSKLMSSWDNPAYFTSAFPTLFPYGTGKHKDMRRSKQLSLKVWASLLLRHCSRSCVIYFGRLTVRRFQKHPQFIILAFDVARRDHTIKQTSIHTHSRHWASTEQLLESLTPDELKEAANQAQEYKAIENPAVRALLRSVDRVGAHALGSDAKRFHMFAELKSSVVYYGLPVIYLTLNPGERHSPLALLYAGEDIDVTEFCPDYYNVASRMEIMLDHPLAVVEYFHTTLRTILSTLIKGGLFGEVLHHYGTIEYQGRGTPHIHLLVRLYYYSVHSNVC